MAVTDVTSVSVESYKLTVTGLLAITCPVRVPEVEGGRVAVGDSIGIDVSVCEGIAEAVGVGDSFGVDAVGVGVAVGGNASHVYVETICSKTADSAA